MPVADQWVSVEQALKVAETFEDFEKVNRVLQHSPEYASSEIRISIAIGMVRTATTTGQISEVLSDIGVHTDCVGIPIEFDPRERMVLEAVCARLLAAPVVETSE